MKLTADIHLAGKRLQEYLVSLGVPLAKNKELMLTAFVHKSYANDYTTPIVHNERLEFVGDGVLGAVTNKLLFSEFAHEAESQLTLYKIALVREETLADVARDIKLGEQLFIGNGEEKSEGREKDAILADSFEALLGYVYLDHGEDIVESIIATYVYPKLEGLKARKGKSHKSLVQERCQQSFHILPEYNTNEHSRDAYETVDIYESIVSIKHEQFSIKATGYGKNKKKAQEEAAKHLRALILEQK